MKLNINSISSKIYKYFYNTRILPNNLCPYFWKLVLAYLIIVIFAPFHIIPLYCKQYRYSFKENLFFTTGLLIIILAILTILNPILLIWIIPVKNSFLNTYILTGIIADLTIITFLFCFIIKKFINLIISIIYNRDITDRVKTNNILISFIKAKFQQFCPQIEWINKTKTT